MLDSDAFEAFKEKGIFDPAMAQSYRKNILEPGGIEEAMVLYKRFRGAAMGKFPQLDFYPPRKYHLYDRGGAILTLRRT